MALTTNKQKIDEHQKILDSHEENLKEQKNITLFFIIIVATSVVATLIGLGGIYINTINQNNKFELEVLECNIKNQKIINEYEFKIEKIMIKYPWINID